MQEGGWIKLYRSIRKHWLWEDAEKLKWWIDILLQANHKDSKFLLGSELIVVERGSFHTSEVKLMKRWRTTKTTTRRFLELLESDHMITTIRTKKGTTIKVSNYEGYQVISDEEKTIEKPYKNHTVDHKKTIEKPYKNHTVYTNKNDKEYIKNNKEGEEGEERKEEVPSLPPLSFPASIYKNIFDIVGEVGYRTWFKNATITEKGNLLTIEVEQEFKKNIIQTRYVEKLTMLLKKSISVKVGD